MLVQFADDRWRAQTRHLHIKQENVRTVFNRQLHRRMAVGGLTDDFDGRVGGQQLTDALPEQRVVVCQRARDLSRGLRRAHRASPPGSGTRAVIVVPAPIALSIVRFPLSCSTRSVIDTRPPPPGVSGAPKLKPHPLSDTATVTSDSLTLIVRRISLGTPCRK